MMELGMKLRVIVMNGQRIVEAEEDGVWKVLEVSKAGKLRAGIYNLYLSQLADKTKHYNGIVVHSTDEYLYQQSYNSIISHLRSDFYQMLPKNGTLKKIVYDTQGKARINAP